MIDEWLQFNTDIKSGSPIQKPQILIACSAS